LVDNLGDVFIAVINEIMTSHPTVKIHQQVMISPGVFCDAGRMGQLLSNLLGNAVAHGARDQPIEVIASMQENHIVLSVMNHGPEIPDISLPLLLQPFKRSAGGGRGEGLGLGLYIASQIVTGHNGTLSVTSTSASGTRFVARFPGTLEWMNAD